MYLLDR